MVLCKAACLLPCLQPQETINGEKQEHGEKCTHTHTHAHTPQHATVLCLSFVHLQNEATLPNNGRLSDSRACCELIFVLSLFPLHSR